ncbi:MAG: 30S ribosomal protein S5, partial [Phycisphaerales bacterium]
MAEILDESSSLESTTIAVQRTSSTVKGGRRFSFGALVVVGDRRGRVGYGYGKSNEVPSAIEKAQKYARKAMRAIPMVGTTIPHQVQGTFRASTVRLIPASPGTGVVAGQSIRAILEMAGITDCLTKCFGSTNSINILKAAFDGIAQLRTAAQIAELRGVTLGPTEIEAKIEKGKKFVMFTPKPRAPEEKQDRRGGRGGRGGGGGGRGGRGGGGGGGGG